MIGYQHAFLICPVLAKPLSTDWLIHRNNCEQTDLANISKLQHTILFNPSLGAKLKPRTEYPHGTIPCKLPVHIYLQLWNSIFNEHMQFPLATSSPWTRADSRFAPSQWETAQQSNAVSHWLGANQESALMNYWVSNLDMCNAGGCIQTKYIDSHGKHILWEYRGYIFIVMVLWCNFDFLNFICTLGKRRYSWQNCSSLKWGTTVEYDGA